MSRGCAGCLSLPGIGRAKEKEMFQGLPYDSLTYYASGMAGGVEAVRSSLRSAIQSGGIQGVKAEPYMIRMKTLFSERREYLVVSYGGVHVYVLITPFGKDLYASWISFFHLGCLQRLARFGRAEPTALDIDDVNMLGQGIDVYLRDVLDRSLREAGVEEEAVQKMFAGVKRKRFVKA